MKHDATQKDTMQSTSKTSEKMRSGSPEERSQAASKMGQMNKDSKPSSDKR